jgi:hypothetical protein
MIDDDFVPQQMPTCLAALRFWLKLTYLQGSISRVFNALGFQTSPRKWRHAEI